MQNSCFAAPNYTYSVPSAPMDKFEPRHESAGKVSGYNGSVVYDEDISENEYTYGENLSEIDAKLAVKKIGYVLAKNAGIKQKVLFNYSKEKTDNATTDVSGVVTVYRGIIDYCEKEDELAFIIAHELAHASNYHCVKSIGTNLATDVISDTVGPAIMSTSGNWMAGIAGAAIVNVATTAVSSKYSRVHENDADIYAVDYMVKSGYNPLAGISILFKIGDVYKDFFSDHPSTEKRLANIYNYVKQKYPYYLNQGIDVESYWTAVEVEGLN